MDIRIEQECPQCGAPVTLFETDRLLTCPYCGVKSFLHSFGAFRYYLPDKLHDDAREQILYAPYIRFKSNVYQVNEKGISYKVIDTTRLGFEMPGLPPTLGVRPQAMKIRRVTPKTKGRFLRLSTKAKVILEKAIQSSRLLRQNDGPLYHRAFIGDTVSIIYQPTNKDESNLLDSVTNNPLISLDKITKYPLKGTAYNPRWQVHFLPALCPHCGWSLEGEGDCLVPTCTNCDSAWEISDRGLQRLDWMIQPGNQETFQYLPFWKIHAHVPELKIFSFADFVHQTNLPIVPKKEWHEKVMSFMIPAFKLRPKTFLQVSRQMTINQWKLNLEPGHVVPELYPVNLPQSEAKQAVKVTLAEAAVNTKDILPHLPRTRLKNPTGYLAYLPFIDKGYDWFQPHTETVIAKSTLHFGRTL